MDNPSKVRVGYRREHQPLIDAMNVLQVVIGSIEANKVVPGATGRLLCFTAENREKTTRRLGDLRAVLGRPLGKVVQSDLPEGGVVVVFLAVAVVET